MTMRSSDKTIEIKVAVPRLSRQLFRVATIGTLVDRISKLNKRELLVGGVSLVVLSAIVTANILQDGNRSDKSHAISTSPLDRLERGTPNYPTLLPAGKTSEQLGGWTRISPPERDPVYAYTDTINGVSISVSQQPIPKDLKKDTATKVKEMAHEFNANVKLAVEGGTLYIGNSSNGPQSVIMTKDDLLILMKSTAPLASKEWGKYATSLQ